MAYQTFELEPRNQGQPADLGERGQSLRLFNSMSTHAEKRSVGCRAGRKDEPDQIRSVCFVDLLCALLRETIGTYPVGELCVGVFLDVPFKLIPVSFIIANFLAPCTNG
jgi:hypothetical protein